MSAYTCKESPTGKNKKGREKEEIMVLHPFTIVTSRRYSIKAEVGQEHFKGQGFPQGKGTRRNRDLSTDKHGQMQNDKPFWNSFTTNTRRHLQPTA